MQRYSPTERIKILLLTAFALLLCFATFGGVRSSAQGEGQTAPAATQQQPAAAASPAPAQEKKEEEPRVEGCLSCHQGIEPMHRVSTDEARDKLRPDGTDGQRLSCTYCHGGNPFVGLTDAQRTSIPRSSREFEKLMEAAHVRPRFPDRWKGKDGKYSSANPERTNALLAAESRDFVRFVNPADFRVAAMTCSSTGCHTAEVRSAQNSMMRHGAMLWGAALYNNGGYPIKDTRFGESYSEETGAPEALVQVPAPGAAVTRWMGVIPLLQPLPRWEVSQPGNVLRVFERGGRRRLEVGLPDREEEPGRPDKGLSPRGFGTLNRTDPVYLGLQKTRLLDPTLNFLGTNDHPGDYRSSGCTACHVVYANDSSITHSSQVWAKFGNGGTTSTGDEQLKDKKNEPGHPIKHQFTNQIPTSQCMTCHMHPGTNMLTTYLGFTWWDNETDAKSAGMYPARQRNVSAEEEYTKLDRNPEGASVRGNWSDPDFLRRTGKDETNSKLERTQFADFHGHGWIYRAVFKKDRAGNLLDANGERVSNVDSSKLKAAVEYRDLDNDDKTGPPAGQPVHLKDVHLERGMHCVDCHFRQDSHGNGILYNEPRAAIEIGCEDCHGTLKEQARLVTSGFAAGLNLFSPAAGQEIKPGTYKKGEGRNMTSVRELRTPFTRRSGGREVPLPVFQKVAADQERDDLNGNKVKLKAGDIVQNSMVVPGLWWRVKQTKETVDEKSADYNWRSAYAKTVRVNEDKMETWGEVPADESKLAHPDSKMTCYSCHTSWMTSCFGCHLSMRANAKMPNRHNEGGDSRNFTTYNFQVLRDDVFMLGKDGTVTGGRIAPVRSSSAVLVSSQNQNREWIYSQQQTVSTEGYSGQAFNTHVPHTVRSTETMGCADCHVSEKNDNNAWMAQVLLQGTNFVNFMGRYVYVAAEHSLEVVPVTAHTEPQAVIGSTLHEAAYPDDYKKFVAGGRELKTFFEHKGNPKVLQVQLRGEYAYVAAGEGGLRIYDVAQIDHKGFSERITTAPVSRFGQRFWVKTKYATAVAAPSTLAVDPARARLTSDGKWVDPATAKRMWDEWQAKPQAERQGKPHPLPNEEQPIHPLYAYLYVADREEGLVLVNAATLLDGDPLNNFLKRALTYNPGGALTGANNVTIAGTHAYVTTDSGLVIININDPLNPTVAARISSPDLKHPKAVAVQFRYAFVVDEEGLKVVDVTDPTRASLVRGAHVQLGHAHDVYVARTYAYVANGSEGIAIVDVQTPDRPRLHLKYDAEGKLNDAHQVKVAMTNASLFAYVADGKNGLRILQLTSPETMPTYGGFSPAPEPRLIATFHTHGPAVAVSKGLDRDRAVDESGNQVAVFGRRGARPFTLEEMRRLYLLDGRLRTVLDTDELKEAPPRLRNPVATSNRDATGANDKSKNDRSAAVSKPSSVAPSSPAYTSLVKVKTAAGWLGGFGLLLAFFAWRKRRRMGS